MTQDQFLAIVYGISAAILLVVLIEFVFRRSNLLSLWWNSGLWSPPAMIEYRSFSGEVKQGRPVGICGLCLVLSTETGRQLISAGAALDRDAFWRTWKYFGGQAGGWVDEAGDPFDPTE